MPLLTCLCPYCFACLCLQTIAAAFSHKSPFAAPLEKQDELERIKVALAAPAAAAAADAAAAAAGSNRPAAAAARAGGLAAGQQSDQLLLIAAFEMWRLTGAASGEKVAATVSVWQAVLGFWAACCDVSLLLSVWGCRLTGSTAAAAVRSKHRAKCGLVSLFV